MRLGEFKIQNSKFKIEADAPKLLFEIFQTKSYSLIYIFCDDYQPKVNFEF